MTLARVSYILGIVLIIWSIISGLNVVFEFSDEGSFFHSDYSFKIGLFLIGLLLFYLGRRSKAAN